MDREWLGDSDCLDSAGWELQSNGTGDLELGFKDGSVYVYHNVSPLVYSNLLRVTSKGWFFNRYIRNNYSFDSL